MTKKNLQNIDSTVEIVKQKRGRKPKKPVVDNDIDKQDQNILENNIIFAIQETVTIDANDVETNLFDSDDDEEISEVEKRAAEKRVYPAINLNKSGTRREELLIKPDLLQKIWVLRKFIHDMDEVEAMEFIMDKMRSTKNNAEFFDMMKK